MAMTPEVQASKAIVKALDRATLDMDMVAYTLTQGVHCPDVAIHLRMADLIMSLGNVWAGWHASGYARGTPMAGVCEQAYNAFNNAGMEI